MKARAKDRPQTTPWLILLSLVRECFTAAQHKIHHTFSAVFAERVTAGYLQRPQSSLAAFSATLLVLYPGV